MNLRDGDAAPNGFFVTVALLFLGSAAITACWCGSMAGMPGMDMPGGWTMSMAWMRMPGQSWSGAASAFIGMWSVMMIAMMLPAIAPVLWRYREVAGRVSTRADSRVAQLALGYFAVWTLAGALAFPVGLALAEVQMRIPALARAVPVASACVILAAGMLQSSRWKTRQLECCRRPPARGCGGTPDPRPAWRHGMRLGLRCCYCCAPQTAVLFVAGVMDLRVMALVTATIAAERLAPWGKRAARSSGIAMIAAGVIYLALRA